MGILNGNSICRSLCNKSLVYAITGTVEYRENRPDVHLYIDGPILLYCGNIKSARVDVQKSIYIIFGKLSKIISTVQSVYNVLGVRIYFDGEAPKEKAERQQQRLERKSDYNIQTIKNRFKGSLTPFWNGIPLLIRDLVKGEAEMEMYRQRQDSCGTVVYTKDTDMFTIAYGHEGESDFIFCQERTSQNIHTYYFYDMKKFTIDGLSRETFAMLMGFVGTDYTESRLTRTQVENIFGGFENKKIQSLPDCNITTSDIENFLNNLQFCKGVRESKKYHKIREGTYLELILWYINYIRYGDFS